MDEKVRQRQALFELREKTLGQILDETVARIPDKEAIVYADRNYRQTWREFADTVDLFAKGLMALGVQKGEKVAVWASNVPYWVTLQFATAKIGAILITVNTNYREHELEYLLNQSECENIFIMDSLRDHDYIDTLYTLAPELRYQSRDRLSFARLPHLRRVCFLGAEKHRGMYSVPEILSMSVMTDDAEYQARQDSLDPWDAINMQYTSGTTGFPKGVMLTHVGVGLNGYWIGRNQRFTDEDRVCLPVPLFHCFGCVLGVSACVNHGACMVILEAYNPLHVLAAVDSERCTALYGVPTMFLAELEHKMFKRFDVSSLRTGIMAGSVCPEPLMRRVVEDMYMKDITICYGLTEGSPVMTQSDPDDPLHLRCETVGCAMPGIEVRIGDPETCEELPRGEVGEILCRGYNVMKGYYNKPEETDMILRRHADGQIWAHTGDVGYMDEDGFVYLDSRIKRMIIRHDGFKVFPSMIENVISRHPAVHQCSVVGCTDKDHVQGRLPFVYVVLDPEGDKKKRQIVRELRQLCNEELPEYVQPVGYKFISEMPFTPVGKVDYRKLEEEITPRDY